VFSSYPADVLTWIESEIPGHVSGPDFVGVGAYRIDAELNVEILQDALTDLIEAHRILRTILVPTPDGLRHRTLPSAPPARLTLLDLDSIDDAGDGNGQSGRTVPKEIVAAIQSAEYPGDRVPLVSAFVGRHSAGAYTLALAGNHIVVDHWSMELLMRDLAICYDARLTGREPGIAPRQYEDSARAAIDRYTRPRIDRAIDYWRRALADVPPLVPTAEKAGTLSAEFHFTLELDRARLTAVSRSARTTPFVTLLTGYCLALRTVAGVDDVVVPLFTSGRERLDWETVGPFMNTIDVRVDLAGVRSVPEALARTHRAFVEALANEVPMAALLPEVPQLAPLYSEQGVPVAGFELIQFPQGTIAPLACDRLPVGPRHGATVLPPSGLLCWLEADGGKYVGTVRYRPGLFDVDWVNRLTSQFTESLHHILSAGEGS
jgi:hypothetical protein